MAVWTAKFSVRDRSEDWLRDVWVKSTPLRLSYGCTEGRLLRHSTEPHIYLVVAEFPTVEAARAYEQASAMQLGGDALQHFVDRQLVDFYSGDAFESDSGDDFGQAASMLG